MSVSPLEFLDRTALFGGLDPQFKQVILERLEQIELPRGHVVFKEGDSADALYLVVEGQAQVFVTDRQIGIEVEVARLGTHEAFGEVSLLTGEPRKAGVRALTPMLCYVLKASVFRNVLLNAPQVALAICRTLATRLDNLNRERGINIVSLSKYTFDRGVYSLIPHHVLMQKRAVPVQLEDDTVTVAMVDAMDSGAIDELRRMLRGYNIRPVAVTQDDYERHLREVINPAMGARKPVTPPNAQQSPRITGQQARRPGGARATARIEYIGQGGPADDERQVQLPGEEVKSTLEAVIAEGVAREASDIHIEPHSAGVDVRFRVEGTLERRDGSLDRRFMTPLVSRVKVLAGLDISERRRPQDGRIALNVDGNRFDMRVSTMPTNHGEKVVLRIVDPSGFLQPLTRLILAKQIADSFRAQIFAPHGVVFVTGPTGSGKTTTLYSALNERRQNASHINILTVEDPVEFDLEGVNQVQVNPAHGLDFPDVLRAFLRQDPDVILVGEIRDQTSAKIALEAALTGHLVLTSVHTNDALGAVDRLRQMGLPSYLVANAVNAVVAQRLVRRICSQCAQVQESSPNILRNLTDVGVIDAQNPYPIYGGAGCETCNGSGFKGRAGLYEVLQVNAALRTAIGSEVTGDDLRKAAERRGLVGFNRYARFLLQNGITTPSEVLRNLPRREVERE